jgi:hypothetical protein
MAVTVSVLIPAKQAEVNQTVQYTATTRTIIDKFTATNTTAANVTISVHLIPSGGNADNTNLIVDTRTIAPDETYTFPELVGHALEPSGAISTIAGTIDALTIRASGREISSV